MTAARLQKLGSPLDGDFFQSFQTVGGKTRHRHCHALRSGGSLSFYCSIGGWLQPFGRAKARLESRHNPHSVPSDTLAQQPRCLVAVAVVGVAQFQRTLRHAVEAEQQNLGREIKRG